MMVEKQLVVRKDGFELAKVEFDLRQRFALPISVPGMPPMPSKPKTALWTSTFREETRSSEWSEWCEQEDFPTGDRFFVLTPRQGTKVLSVNDENDEARLPLTKSGQIDFEAIASWGFDGLRTPCGRCGGLFDTWDCESTVWFNCDWIATVEEV